MALQATRSSALRLTSINQSINQSGIAYVAELLQG